MKLHVESAMLSWTEVRWSSLPYDISIITLIDRQVRIECEEIVAVTPANNKHVSSFISFLGDNFCHIFSKEITILDSLLQDHEVSGKSACCKNHVAAVSLLKSAVLALRLA